MPASAEQKKVRSRRLLPASVRALIGLLDDAVTLAAAGGVVLLGLAIPVFEETRGDWRTRQDYSVTFLDRNGAVIGARGVRQSDAVPLAVMPKSLIDATLATEDRRFYDHFGIDLIGTARALALDLQSDDVVQGGSSITQQLAKNLFLSNERTIDRKIREAFLALWLEGNLSKREILELYLQRAYLGGGNFGVAAASRFYFGKDVSALTLSESAMLAGLFKAPARYAPHLDSAAAEARASQVLANMVEAGVLSPAEAEAARAAPARLVQTEPAGAPDYFLDWAYREVRKVVPSGDRTLTVRTTLDPALQSAAESAMADAFAEAALRYGAREGALVLADPDGAVRALVGGRDYGASQFNRATDALRQPGSAFKPFVYAAAVERGYGADSLVDDTPVTLGNWSPRNYGGKYYGRVPLATALAHSLNAAAVRIADAVGRDAVIALAHRLGITTPIADTRALPLGTTEVTLLDMTGAYAAFANGGTRATPYPFTLIANSHGAVVFDRLAAHPILDQVLAPGVVSAMNHMLNGVTERGTGRAARVAGVAVAGKTGTTNAYRDAWFIGFTGDYVGGLWFGNDDYAPTIKMTGGSLPAATFGKVMAAAENHAPHRPIPWLDAPPPDAGPAEPRIAIATPEAVPARTLEPVVTQMPGGARIITLREAPADSLPWPVPTAAGSALPVIAAAASLPAPPPGPVRHGGLSDLAPASGHLVALTP